MSRRSSFQSDRLGQPSSACRLVYDDHSTRASRPKTAYVSSTRSGRSYGTTSWRDDTARPSTAAPRASKISIHTAHGFAHEDDTYMPNHHQRTHEGHLYDRNIYGSSYGSGHAGHVQAQRQTFRSAQASKQMVLGVYGNCITMLEEMESRELRHQGRSALSRSDIYLPSQTRFDDKTIQRKMDTQLLLLQSQLQSCDAEIRDEVKEEMTDGTLQWMSARAVKSLGKGQTDKYAGKLFEVVQKGTTEHPDVFYKPPTIGERDMHGAMQALVIGSHKRDKLDEDFRTNPDKRASSLRLRPGSGRSLGAERMLDARPDLYSRLNGYVADSLR